MEEGFGCQDGEGEYVDHGAKFHPYADDYCHQCVCDNGTARVCLSQSCGKPPNCVKFERVEKTCCSFICSRNTTSGTDALSTAGIRLAASTASCVLIVALILLLMHKLRRHRLFLNIRQGLRGQDGGADAAVVYSSAYDGVDIDISYQPLHIPGAPPPYSPTCESLELPPAYTSVPADTTPPPDEQNGVINSGCQATPLNSMYNLRAEAKSSNSHPEAHSPQPFDDLKLVERTCGVGASNTDLTLTVDLSDSGNEVKDEKEEQLSSTSSLSPYLCHIPPISDSRTLSEAQKEPQFSRLPIRLDPIGGELPASPSAISKTTSSSISCPERRGSPIQRAPSKRNGSPVQNALAVNGAAAELGAVSKSADSSPTTARHSRVTLTQYGFIDDGSISDLLESHGTVIGLREEQLIGIAANKPDRLNARVRRQNRIKRNSKQLPSTPDMQ